MPKGATGAGRGKRPQPVERKRARGEAVGVPAPGPDSPALVTPAEIPPAPGHLDEASLEVWRRLWTAGRTWLGNDPDYDLMAMLVDVIQERAMLARFCRTPSNRWRKSKETGRMFPHPAVQQLRDTETRITTWMSQLGFTPSDRARLGLLQIRVADELDEYAKRKAERARAGAAGQVVDTDVLDPTD